MSERNVDIGRIGPPRTADLAETRRLVQLQLAACGLPTGSQTSSELEKLADGLIVALREKERLHPDDRCPADRRIEAFLGQHFSDLRLEEPLHVPSPALELTRHGIARELSLPLHGDRFESPLLQSYRVRNGVLHNPKSDRRTTKGTFHVVEGGLPVPAGKKSVPREAFVALLREAVSPPREHLELPFTRGTDQPAHSFVSLLLRPVVCPEVPGVSPEKSLETRFFAPGNFVANLDFVETIFGNAGNADLPACDAALDVEHWTGHTGCVILAPHLTRLRKRDLGLPSWSDATDRQRADGMCWREKDELYNDGVAFKVTCRGAEGVMVTLIADNYFGYCKKEVKTQISYAANLFGNAEEEHAGGAIAFRSYNLGVKHQTDSSRYNGRSFEDVARDYGSFIDIHEAGYGVDRRFPELVYVNEMTTFDIETQKVRWQWPVGQEREMPLESGRVYMTPSGYQVRLAKHPAAPSWRLIGTVGDGIFCHKPCTVSGGGKSEISKTLRDYMIYGPVFVSNIEEDLDFVEKIVRRDYIDRWKSDRRLHPERSHSRPLLSPERSLGSVIKLLTPSPVDYKDAYNEWLESIPNYVLALVFLIKRFYKPEWGENWRQHFGVDIVNGFPGHEFKFGERKLVGEYLRVGLRSVAEWRTFKVRQDFHPAIKVQTEDDISASVVLSQSRLQNLGKGLVGDSVKLLTNCEYRLFQRPDDAIHRGLDKQTESDLSRGGCFLSNYEPLPCTEAARRVADVIGFEAYSEPMQRFLEECAEHPESLFACSSDPRLIDGVPSRNPRYLQDRPDVVRPARRYIAEMGTRLSRAVAAEDPVHFPVHSVLFGRRNNPPDRQAGIRALAVYNPIHYQELPELFMDFVSSLTGKSPSTTGAGSEGALTKGPFNALRPLADLNNALVSFILTGLHGFSTAAGHVGPDLRVDHDISLLVPEVWCRLESHERDADWLIENDLLEKLEDFEVDGEKVLASRLGYRITYRFVRQFFGRIFDNPTKVFSERILRPEKQGMETWVDGIRNICEAHQRTAQAYVEDGSIEDACPPLRALIEIMAHGESDGLEIHSPELRRLFTLDNLLASDWYQMRIDRKQQVDRTLWERHAAYLKDFINSPVNREVADAMDLESRLRYVEEQARRVASDEYRRELHGTIGADLLGKYPPRKPV